VEAPIKHYVSYSGEVTIELYQAYLVEE
jgi:hypothetical protein